VPRAILRVASDERLVALVRAGSEPAFEQLYERHHRGVLSFCRHMVGSREEAEDAVQHTFLAAYRDLVGSGKPIQLKAWLYAIARNRCLSILRARREHADVDAVQPATDGLSAQVERREDLRGLLGDLAGLPDDQRAALVLAELGDVSHGDIAAVLDCPKDKVKALVFQARSALMDARRARETSCIEIREELSTLTGGALRRAHLRRHLETCDGCRAFRDEVRRQRAALAIVLPVFPSAGLKLGALPSLVAGKAAATGAAVTGAGGAAGATAGAGGAASGGLATAAAAGGAAVAKGLTAKLLIGVAIAATAAGGAVTVEQVATKDDAPPAKQAPGSGGAERKNGVVPVTAAGAGGNRERAHELARSRGNGEKKGLNGEPGKSGAAHGKAGTAGGKAKARSRGRGTQGQAKRAAARAKAKPVRTRNRSATTPARKQPAVTPAPKVEPKVEPTTSGTAGGGARDAAPVVKAPKAAPEPGAAAPQLP
jgi:RNA polymerase sigma factor (sigma-70 family)